MVGSEQSTVCSVRFTFHFLLFTFNLIYDHRHLR